MSMSRRAFYRLTAVLSALGYAWAVWSCLHPGGGSPCLFRGLTGLPCPACGAGRSLRALLLQGDAVQAFLINPLGIVLAVLMTVVPVWLLLDAVRGRNTLYAFFNRVDQTLRRRAAFIAFAGLVLANWCWNLFKGI